MKSAGLGITNQGGRLPAISGRWVRPRRVFARFAVGVAIVALLGALLPAPVILAVASKSVVKPSSAPSTLSVANGKIAFQSDRDGNYEIYVMNADGTGQTRLTNNTASDLAPAWSPDGSKIAFYSNRDGNYEIYVMNADGTGQTRLTNNPAIDWQPTWSPDGTTLAFVSDRDGNNEIYVMNADGTGQTRLTNTAEGEDGPAFSPDGTKIAFARLFSTGEQDIFVMDSNGANAAQLTWDSTAALDVDPSWSPDGSKIAFMSTRTGNPDIFVMNADGSGQIQLTSNTLLDEWPHWSPDGTMIAFSSYRPLSDQNEEIYVMNADGSGQAEITTGSTAENSFPSWQRAQPGTTCRPTGFYRDGIRLTAAVIGTSTPVTGTVDATGCNIGVYYAPGSTGSVSRADISGANYYGVLVDRAGVDVSNSKIHGIGETPFNGSQHGVGVLYTTIHFAQTDTTNSSGTAAGKATGTMSGTTITNYQKNGVVISGDGAAVTAQTNTVIGQGQISYIAQNGIQVSYGASAVVKGNTTRNNYDTDQAWLACGFLLYQAGGVRASSNVYSGNERDQCNVGKGGGQYNP